MPAEGPKSDVITFSVDEPLWGLEKDVHTVRVRYSEHHQPKHEPLFVAALREKNGDLVIPMCVGLELQANHEWVREFRELIAQRSPATLPVRVISNSLYAPVEFADVRVEGNGKHFEGSTGRDGIFTIASLPPGIYTVSAAKPNYSLEGGPATISVPPGACHETTILLKASAHVGGRILDYLGRPVANTEGFDLMGWNVANNERDYRISHTFKTNENGEFQIVGALPGTYYLGANIWGQNHPKRSPLPQVLYPGTLDFRTAAPIIISDGIEISDLTFRLPDLGRKRLLEVTVIGENGEPVPDTMIENGAAPWDDRTMAAIEQRKTDTNGMAVFEIWEIAEYSINAHWIGAKSWRQSAAVSIPPGRGPVKLTIKLPKAI
jgi:hypothetical protein